MVWLSKYKPTESLQIEKAIVLDASGAEKIFNCFNIVGSVQITRLYAVITAVTTLTNGTAAGFRTVDNSGHAHLDAGDGVISALPAGTVIACTSGNSATTPTVLSAAAGNISATTFTSFFIIKKVAQPTYLSFAFTTTDAPANAQMTVYCEYRPMTADGALTTV